MPARTAFRRTLPLLALLALLAAPAITFADGGAHNETARVVAIRGRVLVSGAGADKHSLGLRDEVPPGSLIECASRSFTRLSLPDGSVLAVAPDTRIQLEDNAPGDPALWNLEFGRLRAQVSGPHTRKEKLVIRSHAVALGIRGTDFVVSSSGQGDVALVTIQGSVAMAVVPPGGSALAALNGSGAVLVGAGETSSAAGGAKSPAAPSAVPATMLKQLQNNGSAIPSFHSDGSLNSGKAPDSAGGTGPSPQDRGAMGGPPGSGMPQGNAGPEGGGSRGGGFQGAGGPPNGQGGTGALGSAAAAQNAGPPAATNPGGQIVPPSGTQLSPGGPSAGGPPPGAPAGPQGPGQLPPISGAGGKPPPPPPQQGSGGGAH